MVACAGFNLFGDLVLFLAGSMAIRSPDPALEERSDLPEDGVRAFGLRLV